MCNLDFNTASTPCTVRLTGDLNIYHATTIRDALLPLIAQHRTLAVDLSGIDEIDTAGIQVLMAGRRDALAGGGELQLTGRSKCVAQVIDAMNLSGLFGDMNLGPAAH